MVVSSAQLLPLDVVQWEPPLLKRKSGVNPDERNKPAGTSNNIDGLSAKSKYPPIRIVGLRAKIASAVTLRISRLPVE